MRRFLGNILILAILIFVVYTYRDIIKDRTLSLWSRIENQFFASAPCVEPIPYTLGTFDSQFNISQKYFLNALSQAEAIWEEPYRKKLFTYTPKNSGNILKVNLVYDYRQQATSKLANLGIEVNDTRASYDNLKAKFTALKAEYEREKSDSNSKIQAFNLKQEAYEADVNFWNKKGGAPQEEYNKLEKTRLALKTESNTLQNMQNNISEMVDEINALVVVLNRLASTLNISVDKYNTIGASRGESFEEGIYSSDGVNAEIDIYEFSSQDKLVRVLAHELGHALSLEHVDDPRAMMYELNQGNNKTLTAADLGALQAKCGVVQ